MTGLFEKHGMSVAGFWESVIGGRTNMLYYVQAFKNLERLETARKDFHADPEWQQVASDSERDGPLVASTRNMVLKPTYYSPTQ